MRRSGNLKRKSIILLCTASMLTLLLFASCARQPEKATKTSFMMDTVMELTAYGDNAQKAVDAAIDAIKKIDKLMSVSSQDGDVYRINAAAGQSPVKISKETMYVIQAAQYYSQLSNGLFDITIGPLVNLWGIGTKNDIPTQADINKAKALVDYRKFKINTEAGTAELPENGMAIDLGAIAKGYAADAAKEVLVRYGIKSAVINLGGNVVVIGNKTDGSLWRVGIQNPFEPNGDYVAVVEEADKAVVTSGIYERYFIKDGKRYHHILNPFTGYPADNGLASVSIISDKSIDADALSTLVFLLGPEKGMELVEDLSNIECIMITTDKEILLSDGLKGKVKIVDKGFEYEER